MRKLASRGATCLYADEDNHWIETEMDFDQTSLSYDALWKLHDSGKVRIIPGAPGLLSSNIDNESARQEFENIIEPKLIEYWKAGYLEVLQNY